MLITSWNGATSSSPSCLPSSQPADGHRRSGPILDIATNRTDSSLMSTRWISTLTRLFNDNAVYNNKVWQYERKSDKKIVLSAGDEQTVITIGKEKEGRRVMRALSSPSIRHAIPSPVLQQPSIRHAIPSPSMEKPTLMH